MGQIANTDAQYLSRRLAETGISLYRHTVVGDNPGRVRAALSEALARADLVITTGGLGPTEDDLTKEAVAAEFGLEMRFDADSMRAIEARTRAAGRTLTENSRRQAYFPEGADILPNACGTAPGCVIEHEGRRVAVLPGPPHEMRDMFERQLAPRLARLSGVHLESRFLRVFGIGEPMLETMLSDLFHSDNPTLALYCGPGEITARITARAETREAAFGMIAPIEAEIRRRTGDHCYGEGMDYSIAEAVVELLKARGATVCFAESCTAGATCARLVDIPGASSVLKESYITYCDEAKRKILGVRSDTLRAHTAVSAPTAREMAEGARRLSGADYAVSITGLAGPDGGSEAIPVGTVFIGAAGPRGTQVYEHHFPGDRSRVRTLACAHALNALRLTLMSDGEAQSIP